MQWSVGASNRSKGSQVITWNHNYCKKKIVLYCGFTFSVPCCDVIHLIILFNILGVMIDNKRFVLYCIVLYGPVENVEIFMLIGNLKLYTTKVFFYVDEKLKISHHHRHTF
jgi:hypothetical protein